ncbi:MAG: heavy metal translocating P-type ATPase [Hydrogenothermaceae bacterium]|nr:heavy metal translocating P-type ATPase [Hydrogenothermaceae bacterium]
MPIPYSIKELSLGKLKIGSEFIKYVGVSKEVLQSFFQEKFPDIDTVVVSKARGLVSFYYNPKKSNVENILNFLNTTNGEFVLELLEKEKVKPVEEKKELISSLTWFKLNTVGLVSLLFRGPLGGSLPYLGFALGIPVFLKALSSLSKGKVDVHILDSSAIFISNLTGNYGSSILMTWLLSLGDVIQDKTEKIAKVEIEKLLSYKDDFAYVVDGEQVIKKKVDKVKLGDTVVVYTGQKIVVDGVVLEGEALVNQASLTGESNPVHKKEGDKVYAGTFLEDGKLYIKTEKVGEDTVLAKIVKIIEEGVNQPIEAQVKAEDFANKFVVPTIGIGTSSYLLSGNINRLTATMIVDFHTGIHVSTPLSIMSYMAVAAKRSILFKTGKHLEMLHNVNSVVFDKTGTLTVGKPEITELVPLSISEDELLQIAASLEQRITHPIARSIVKYAQSRGIELLERKNSKYHIGLGIEGEIDQQFYLLGSTKFLKEKHITIPRKVKKIVDELHEKGESVLFLVKDKSIIGLLGVSDHLRPEAKKVVEELYKSNREVILCTGDNEGAAEKVARQLGIRKYYARAFPDEKARIIKELKKQGKRVAFIGDGVNDSPALSVADVGISMRSGADIAIEVADVVIPNDLGKIVEAIHISDRAINKIYSNFRINSVINGAGIALSAFGLISPFVSTIINNGTTVFLGFNSIKPLFEKS